MLTKRCSLVPQTTPVHPLHAVSIDTASCVYIKRDDLMNAYCGSGNKVRKMEYLVFDAKSHGCNALVTSGSVQSNHCATVASIAAKEHPWKACHLVLEERGATTFDANATGNQYLYRLLGATTSVVADGGVEAGVEAARIAFEKQGLRPYVIPGGGSNAIGTCGYVQCVVELTQQLNLADFDYIVCASGSGGTHAGLLAGVKMLGLPVKVLGISVRCEKKNQVKHVLALAQAVSRQIENFPVAINKADVEVWDTYVGRGYALPTQKMKKTIEFFARQEGILLDPVYTGKAAAALWDHRLRGKTVLFVHTGGSNALFQFCPTVTEEHD